MKTILLLRHAKSSWKDPNLADFERPLNKRGKRDAPRMGRLLRGEDLVPDIIYSSPAVRAQMTAESVVDQCGYEGEIIYSEELYPGYPEYYLSLVRNLAEEVNRVLFIGHNPVMDVLLEMLTGEQVHLATASLAYLALPTQLWQDISFDSEAKLVFIWKPRDIS